MAEKDFHELTKNKKIVACIVMCFAVLSGAYCLIYWYNFFLFDCIEKTILRHLLSIGIILTIFSLISIVTWFFGSYVIKLIRKDGNENKSPPHFQPKKDDQPETEEKYTRKGGLGEIDFYWGERIGANEAIRDYLKKKNLREIFIAAIGFGTIENVIKDPDVIKNFKELIELPNSPFKITFVLPDSIENLKKYRPDVGVSGDLDNNYRRGRRNLKEFIQNLAEECYRGIDNEEERIKKIESRIKFRKYTDKAIPRHFILKGEENVIYVGSYLGHTAGKKSYIMKLVVNNKTPQNDDQFKRGLFNLFLNEITHLSENCEVNDTIFEEIIETIKNERGENI